MWHQRDSRIAHRLRPKSHLQFYRTLLSCNIIERQSRRYATVDGAHCNFVAETRIGQSTFTAFSRQSCTKQSTTPFQKGVARLLKSCATHLRFCRAIKLRDKIAGVTSV